MFFRLYIIIVQYISLYWTIFFYSPICIKKLDKKRPHYILHVMGANHFILLGAKWWQNCVIIRYNSL